MRPAFRPSGAAGARDDASGAGRIRARILPQINHCDLDFSRNCLKKYA